MKPIIRHAIIFSLLLFWNFQSEGQYLEVSRAANIKLHHDVNSVTLEKANTGDRYELLLPALDSTNSYYKVKLNAAPGEGWIYRTLVRRFKDSIPDKVIPRGSPVELMILSHTDADHIGAAGRSCRYGGLRFHQVLYFL
jgi:hypothetical protein